MKLQEKVWTYAAVAIFSVIGVICSIMAIAKLPGLQGKEPEWIGALGTIAAFAGTIWLANSETRRRRQDDLMRARLRAAGMFLRVTNAQYTLLHLRFNLLGSIGANQSPENIIAFARPLYENNFWTIEEIEALVPLPNNVAILFAQSLDEINSIKLDFEGTFKKWNLEIPSSRDDFCRTQAHLLKDVEDKLTSCVAECMHALQHMIHLNR